MNTSHIKAALFDLDGVVLDTETHYTRLWGDIGKRYHPEMPDFAQRIKGMTLTQIFAQHFADPQTQTEIESELNEAEAKLNYRFYKNADSFLMKLGERNVPCALVTSSNQTKMEAVYRQLPVLRHYFRAIVTSEDVSRSKPDPQCFLVAAQKLGLAPDECLVFEDSVNGLKAARAAGCLTVGLIGTNEWQTIAPYAELVIDNFNELDFPVRQSLNE